MPDLAELPARIGALPDELRAAAETIFHIEISHGRLVAEAPMEPWIRAHFGVVADVEAQTIVRITNRFTGEGAIVNALRARRPSGGRAGDPELERWITEELQDDIFAQPLRDTPADPFGRIHGRYCVTASNIAKYAGWHGLVIPHEPHPLRFTLDQLRDYLEVAAAWIAAARRVDPGARYPLITWNCLPKSGATIVHSHWQIAIARESHYARVESWRRAAADYRSRTGRDYLGDLNDVHAALGLHIATPAMRTIVHLTPLRSREIVMLGEQHAGLPAIAPALHRVLRALIDRAGTRTFNMAIALPPDAAEHEALPLLVRIGDRGPALTTRNDLGAMELYGTGVIADDPFRVVEQLGLPPDAA